MNTEIDCKAECSLLQSPQQLEHFLQVSLLEALYKRRS